MSDAPSPGRPEVLPPPDLTLAEQELYARLGWFTQVRWGAGLAALAFLALGWYAFGVRFAWRPALAVVLALFAYNLVFSVWARRLYRRRRVHKGRVLALAHAQVTCDLVAVAALVHTIGGVENHFILLFVFPMIVASEFFPPRVAYGYATLAAVLVNVIGWGEFLLHDLAHYSLQVSAGAAAGRYEPLVAYGAARHYVFVLQVCFVMTFAVYVTVFIASSIAGRLRDREAELEAAYRALRSLDHVKSQFMRKTSHELRAPVGAMQSLLKAAETGLAPGDPGRDLVDRALGRSETMLDLIDDLLLYGRLQATRALDDAGPVDLAEVARAAADLYAPQARAKGLALRVEAAGPVVVRGAAERLADLAGNLLANAVRYTPAGGQVTVGAAAQGGRAVLTVADTGIGIAADELPHVFDEFYRGEAAKRLVPHGTGLGLTIAQRVAELHGGRIEAESEAGRGTTFRVVLPLA